MIKTVQVLLAEAHPLLRADIRSALNGERDLELVGEVIDGYEARRLSQTLTPDVLLMDLNISGPIVADTIAYLRLHSPSVKVIVLSGGNDEGSIQTLLAAGMAGYLLKDELPEPVVPAIRSVVQGGTWFSRLVMEQLISPKIKQPFSVAQSGLTERELAVLRLVVAGQTNQKIGRTLGISEKTVEKRLGEVFVKLEVASRVEAAVHAVRAGLV